jgi:flagellar basal-body rod protein FlgF
MSGSLYVAAAGAEARLTQLDVLADNLANVDTAGFRSGTVVFEAELEAALLDQGDGLPQTGRAFVAATQAAIRGESGPIRPTGRDLDAAIQGDGFFVVETPGGPRYTRAGAFRVDPSGFLVGISGHPVLGESGPIPAGDRPLSIDAGGSVLDDAGQRVARLQVVRFDDASALVKEGSSLLRAPDEMPGEPIEPVLASRSLEGSNVQAVQELARMVIVQRAFDAAMRTLEAEDSASSQLLQEI